VLADTAEPEALEDAGIEARSLLGFGVEPQAGGEHMAGDVVSPSSHVSYGTTGYEYLAISPTPACHISPGLAPGPGRSIMRLR
jgi:hypothetical protein